MGTSTSSSTPGAFTSPSSSASLEWHKFSSKTGHVLFLFRPFFLNDMKKGQEPAALCASIAEENVSIRSKYSVHVMRVFLFTFLVPTRQGVESVLSILSD